MTALLTKLLQNKHTSSAALIYLLLAAMDALGPVWFPDSADKISATTTYFRQLAIGYGLLAAGDANAPKPTPPPAP